MKKTIALFACAISGCAHVMQINPVVGEGQKTFFKNDIEYITSEKKSTVIMAAESSQYSSNSSPDIIVGFKNGFSYPVNFGIDNISVYVNDKQVQIYSSDEIISAINDQANTSAVLAGIAGAANQVSAANSAYSYDSGSWKSQSNIGSDKVYGSGTYTGYSYNPAQAQQAAAIAQRETNKNINDIQQSAERKIFEMERRILKKSTVATGDWNGGAIKTGQLLVDSTLPCSATILGRCLIKLNQFDSTSIEPSQIKIRVTIENEVHEFKFTQKRAYN